MPPTRPDWRDRKSCVIPPKQRSTGLASRLSQLLQSCLRFGGVFPHLLDGCIDVGAPLGCEFCRGPMDFVGRRAPGLHLSSSNVSKCRLLLVDLLADGVDERFDLRFEAIPLGFQVCLRALPGGRARSTCS